MAPPRSRKTAAAAFAIALGAAALVAGGPPAQAIHDGNRSTTEDHPWVAAIEDEEGFQFCGGTVLRGRFVLTAAHCVVNRSSGSLRVVVGRTDLRTDAGTVVRVDDIWVHPDYQEVGAGVDLALLTLRSEVTTGSLRLAVPRDQVGKLGQLRKVYGWGRTENHPTGSPVLRTTRLVLAELQGCFPYTEPEESPRERLCGLPPDDGEGSICPGDSGGPLATRDRLVGVVSSGNKFCDSQFPVSVFTRVSTATESLRAQMNASDAPLR
ncbi:MAG: serine protease [Actinomycetota bacterium]|nr:serine protease [Actinomycetota bacterium]